MKLMNTSEASFDEVQILRVFVFCGQTSHRFRLRNKENYLMGTYGAEKRASDWIGWNCDDLLWEGETKKRKFVLRPALAVERTRSAGGCRAGALRR
jgi:hypothetical protein